MKVKRHADRTRLCRICCANVRETDFPPKKWTCLDCLDSGRAATMPVIRVSDHFDRYDTSRVFKGYRVTKVTQGSREEYENEVQSPFGEFYAAGEDTVALYTKSSRGTTMLRKRFPELRVFVDGDDGRAVLLMPTSLFPAVAKHCRAKRIYSNAGKPRNEKQQAAIAKARSANPVVTKKGETPQGTLGL